MVFFFHSGNSFQVTEKFNSSMFTVISDVFGLTHAILFYVF